METPLSHSNHSNHSTDETVIQLNDHSGNNSNINNSTHDERGINNQSKAFWSQFDSSFMQPFFGGEMVCSYFIILFMIYFFFCCFSAVCLFVCLYFCFLIDRGQRTTQTCLKIVLIHF